MNRKDHEEAARRPEGIALFPLPSVALLPGQLMPLHIFEPRYRQMCKDSLEGKSFWVLGRLRPGYEADYQGRPPVYPIAGLGRTVGLKELDDGRWLVALRGVARVAITSELPPDKLYRQVRVDLLNSEQEVPASELQDRLAELVLFSEHLLAQMGGDVTKLRNHLAQCKDPFLQIDMLAAAMAPGPASRQTMLETLNPLERCDKLHEYLSRLVGDPEHDKQLN